VEPACHETVETMPELGDLLEAEGIL
jgi:hypothetical protein